MNYFFHTIFVEIDVEVKASQILKWLSWVKEEHASCKNFALTFPFVEVKFYGINRIVTKLI